MEEKKNPRGRPRKPEGAPKSPKTGGRAKGTPNKVTKDTREFLNDFISDEKVRKEFKEAFRQIADPYKKAKVYLEACSYNCAKPVAVDLAIAKQNDMSLQDEIAKIAAEEM